MPSKTINFDPYATLNIEQCCDESQIDKAYKKSALKWHPDKNPENKEKAKEMFLKIYEAYEFLKDKVARLAYDEGIAAKRRRTEYEEVRRASSSAKRNEFLEKLNQREAAYEKTTKKRKSEQNLKDDIIEELRRQGAEMLKKMKEEKQQQVQLKEKRHEEKLGTKRAKPQDFHIADLDELEKAVLGDLI